MRKLIMNCDDFGLCPSVNEAVKMAYLAGTLKSTTILANADYFDHAVSIAKENPGLGVGVHLVLSTMKPLTDAKTLVDENGNFHKQTYYFENEVSTEDIEKEFRAQIEKVKNAGIKITHFDGHHHLYAIIPNAYEVSKKLAKEYNVPLRNYHHETGELFIGEFSDEYYKVEDVKGLISIIENHKHDVLELMCHISTASDLDTLKKYSSYAEYRANELAVITSDDFKKYLKENEIEITNYNL